VNSYTITIAANDDSGNTTTLLVDTSGGEVMITDVHLHAGGGLSGGRLPTVDFGLLLRAVNATSAPQSIESAPTNPSVAAEPTASAGAAVDERSDTTATPRAGRAARTRRRAAKAEPEATPTPAARRGRGGRASAAKTAAAPKAATARKASRATKVAAASGERAYRRMPDDFVTVYEQIGAPGAIAEHYGVPRYTVHGWIRRIRAIAPSVAE